MILLQLFCFFGVVHGGTHNLHYIYTAFSQPVTQPGLYKFTAMGILNDRPIDTYNSEDRVKTPMQEWMGIHNDKDYWEKGTQSRRSKEQWFNINVDILINRMHHNKSDLHVLQWIHGCEAEETPDGKLKFLKGFDQYGYDGADFLSFDSGNDVWVAPVVQAEPTKLKWDGVPVLSQYTKGYLTTDCVQWMEKFVNYQKAALQTHSPPEVYIFSKKTAQPDYRTLVCLATGFYPKDVAVNILRDGSPLDEVDGVASSGVRPNGDEVETYQLRKTLQIKASDPSKYSCRIEHSTLKEPILKYWDGECCDCDTKSNTGIIAGAIVFIVIIAAAVAGGLFLYKKRKGDGGPQPEPNNAPRKSEMQPLNGVAVISGHPPEKQPLNGKQVNGSEGSLESGDSGNASSGSGPTMNNGGMKQLSS